MKVRPPLSRGRGWHHATSSRPKTQRPLWLAVIAAFAVAVVTAAIVVTGSTGSKSSTGKIITPAVPSPVTRQVKPESYLGVFAERVPQSYRGVAAFTAATGVRPDMVSYYSGWGEPFQADFAAAAVKHHAVPLVQIDPTDVSIKAIAAGDYDGYLRSYAAAVKAFGGQVVLSFGHEMNGTWYSWGYHHTNPALFVAAWRHIVDIFRQQGARKVAWLWTINVIDGRAHIPSPAPWWPGNAYVTWVGIDGYYYKPSWTFASLFGPTIKAVRALTIDPILISETAVAPAANKPAKIADLFAGIRAYGLLGFVWFDTSRNRDWRLNTPAAIAAFRRGARTYSDPTS